MTSSINPIAAEATRKTLVENDRLDANHNDSAASRATLDTAELRDLERSLYVSTAAGAKVAETPPMVSAPASTRRSLLDRLLRRG